MPAVDVAVVNPDGQGAVLPGGFTSVVSPPPTGSHGYFDALRAWPQHLRSWSLRDQAQLNSLVADPVATDWRYAPAGDSYPLAQDAAKLYIPSGRATSNLSTKQQLKMALPSVTSGSLLVTWDWWWGTEFRTQRGGMNHYKVFKFHIGGHSIWTLMHSPAWCRFPLATEVAKLWDSFATPSGAPTGMQYREPWTPAGLHCPNQRNDSSNTQQVSVPPTEWMRYWVEWKLFQPHTAFAEWNQVTGQTLGPNGTDPQGRWHMVSQWYATESTGPRRLLYRIPVGFAATWSPTVSEFTFLMNTSQTSGFIGPWIGYGRNVVVLRDYPAHEADTTLFQRPVA